MTRRRLRPAYSPEQLQSLYRTPHDHSRWPDHHLRVNVTVQVARWLVRDKAVESAADLSCGDGYVLGQVPARRKFYGDLAPGYEFQGPIDKTLTELPHDVDLFVCSETLEHLDDPDAALAGIRTRARQLVLSTPVDAWSDDNPEHYWAWSRADVEDMLAAAGWGQHVYTAVDFRPIGLPYCFGIWGAR